MALKTTADNGMKSYERTRTKHRVNHFFVPRRLLILHQLVRPLLESIQSLSNQCLRVRSKQFQSWMLFVRSEETIFEIKMMGLKVGPAADLMNSRRMVVSLKRGALIMNERLVVWLRPVKYQMPKWLQRMTLNRSPSQQTESERIQRQDQSQRNPWFWVV